MASQTTGCSRAQANQEHDRILFGLPVVLDTADDSIAVGDTLLLQYEVHTAALHQCKLKLQESTEHGHEARYSPKDAAVSGVGTLWQNKGCHSSTADPSILLAAPSATGGSAFTLEQRRIAS